MAVDEAFAIRGIKGLWWDGIELYDQALPWVAEHDLNFLMLCYTSFAASARNWRSDYSSLEKVQMHELASRAREQGVHLCLAVNPSLYSNPPIVYSGEEDYQALIDKLRGVHELGIHWFALCLDDISTKLEPADAARFGVLQNAHVHLVNRLWNDLKALTPQPSLIFCPSTYTTWDALQHPDYIKAIGKEVSQEVMVFWTGPTAFSSSITVEDAELFGSWIGRKPFVWDNYPANDFYAWRPLLAPLKNRDVGLGGAVCGYLANSMKQWHASQIPFETMAAYLNDPNSYDPRKAMEELIASHPDQQQNAVRLLADLYGSTFWGEPNFPSRPPLSDIAGAGHALPRYHLLRALLSDDPGMSELWEDIWPTLERDILLLERKVSAHDADWPVKLTGIDFDSGGAADFGYHLQGRDVNYVYAKPTGRDEMRAEFDLSLAPESETVITIVARNGDGALKARVQIVLNEWMLVDSEPVFSGDGFTETEWPVPSEALVQGHNVITIRSVDLNGTLGKPPWFMVAEVVIGPKQQIGEQKL